MRRPRLALLVAVIGTLALALGTAGARAEDVVPAEGEWLGITTGGHPVGFTVSGGQITKLHFVLDWGFCGAYEAAENGYSTPTLEPDGEWKYLGSGGEFIEGAFVSPERAEGRVVAPERELPSCPHTEANFAAELGRVPTQVKPQVFAIGVRGTGHHSIRPRAIGVRPGFYFILKWKRFGERVALATGNAYIDTRKRVYSPHAIVRLSHLVPHESRYELYTTMTYTLRGPIPQGLRRRAVLNML